MVKSAAKPDRSGISLVLNLLLMGSVLSPGVGKAAAARPASVLVEAEAFDNPGGWVVDPQFMDVMGSPYVLAHGLGRPVPDAVTTVELPGPGTYHVWVRTKDWVATWKAPGAPGRFQLLIDGQTVGTTLGTQGAEWHWQSGGVVRIENRRITLALHDLTGFEGRCDAILLTTDDASVPKRPSLAASSISSWWVAAWRGHARRSRPHGSV